MTFTKYSHLTNAELLRLVDLTEHDDPLIRELVSRIDPKGGKREPNSATSDYRAAENLHKMRPK